MYLLQIIAIATYATVMICAMNSFRKTVIVWLPISLLFNPQVCLFYTGSPIALTVAVNLSLVALFFTIKKKEVLQYGNKGYFGLTPFIALMFFSLLISSLFSVIPFSASFNKLIKSSIVQYGMIYVFFRSLNSMDDIRLFLKTAIVVIILITVDGMIENFTHINIAGDFIYLNSPHYDYLEGRSYYVPSFVTGAFRSRYGLTRCYSFFSLHIEFGITCALLLFLLINVLKNKWPIFKKDSAFIKIVVSVCIGLLAIGVVFSNSKTPMLGTCVLLLAYYNLRQFLNVKLMIPLLIGIILILLYVPNYVNNFLALTDEDIAAEGQGSTVAMRQQQMELIMKLFTESPLIGNGINAAQYFSKNVSGFDGILGAESCWFTFLADQGILGCLAYVYMFRVCYVFSQNIVPHRILLFFLLAILCMDTTTGVINILLWAPIMLVIRRYYQLSNFGRIL